MSFGCSSQASSIKKKEGEQDTWSFWHWHFPIAYVESVPSMTLLIPSPLGFKLKNPVINLIDEFFIVLLLPQDLRSLEGLSRTFVLTPSKCK